MDDDSYEITGLPYRTCEKIFLSGEPMTDARSIGCLVQRLANVLVNFPGQVTIYTRCSKDCFELEAHVKEFPE